jgi:tetratricopeptide (TPR) repeat protein
MTVEAKRWRPGDWLLGLLLVAATILTFQPAWHAGFIWDDDAYVTENKLLSAPDGLRRIWFSRDLPSQYFPLTYTLFWAEHKLWGLNPAGYHWMNLLLHAINALLVWRILKRLGVPGAWFAAALFALHPVQVETVAWVTEAKNILSLFFYLLAVSAWLAFLEIDEAAPASNQSSGVRPLSERWLYYCLALLSFLLALFSKTTACTLPVALLLISWLRHKPINRQRLMEVAPFFAVGFILGLATMWWERHHIGTSGTQFAIGWLQRVLIVSRAIWFYAGKLLWPADLVFTYPRWRIDPAHPLAYSWLLLFFIVCGLIYFGRRFFGRSLETAAAFYAVTLGPMLGFIMLYTFRYTFVADHYQYLACIGPFALVGAGVSQLMIGRIGRMGRIVGGAVCGCVLLVLAGLSWRQSSIYHDSETLWRTTVKRNPASFLAHYQLGNALLKKGELEQGLAEYRVYLQMQPADADAHYNAGNVLFGLGRLDEAILHYQKSLEIHPSDVEAHNNLGAALIRKGRFDEAINQFQQALAIRPDFAKASNNLSQATIMKRANGNEPTRGKPE